MFAVGHIALGYIMGKASSKVLNLKVYVPLVFAFSLLPDIDLLIPYLKHRGPTHSLIVIVLFFLPFFIVYGKKITPYFVATVQHSLIGDFLSGKIQLFWPVSKKLYGFGIPLTSNLNITCEWIFFLTSLILMLTSGDFKSLLRPHPLNLILIIPIYSLFSPVFLDFPLRAPTYLVIPHLAYLGIFSFSIVYDIKKLIEKKKQQ